jgi:hypothetical protein
MDLDEVIKHYHQALDEFSRGDAEPIKRVFSHRGDVVLANPFGPAVRGWGQAPRRWSMPRLGSVMEQSRRLRRWRGMRAQIWW